MRLLIVIKVDQLKKIIVDRSCDFVSNSRFILSNCSASQAQHIYIFVPVLNVLPIIFGSFKERLAIKPCCRLMGQQQVLEPAFVIHMGLSDCTTPGSQMDNNSEEKSWNLNLLETGKAVCHAGLVMVSASQKVLISVQPLDLRKGIQS